MNFLRLITANDLEKLEAIIAKLKGMQTQKISLRSLNNLLKGLFFAQEIYLDTSMDYFFKQFQEKYKFLIYRGSDKDEIMFQGGSAEGLSILSYFSYP